MGARGFTLPELVMVIVIIGILAVMAAPRLMSSQGFLSRGFYDEAKAVVRFAQKTAIARRSTVTVCVSATEISAISNANCAAPVAIPHPVGGAPLLATVPSGVTLTSSVPSFTFDGLGRSSGAVTITLTSTIADDPARTITVAAETGYVL
jgi:MSHA pilin protein MshC